MARLIYTASAMADLERLTDFLLESDPTAALHTVGLIIAERTGAGRRRDGRHGDVLDCGGVRGCERTQAADDRRAGWRTAWRFPVQTEHTPRRFLHDAPADFLVKYRNHEGSAASVRRQLENLPESSWPGFEVLAKEMHISAPTLRRRLYERYRAVTGR